MPIHVETDVSVQRFAFTQDDGGRRLTFPHAETKRIEGRAGAVTYGAEACTFENLSGRLDMLRWTADRSSIGGAWLRDDNGRFDISVANLELPNEVMLTRAEHGIEIVTPMASMSDMKLSLRGPFGRVGTERPERPARSESQELLQDKLHFLDELSGRIYLTIKVVLDLPVIGKRTLDQKLKVPIQQGKLNFRALENSLDWLEGTFLDLEHDKDTLALQWKVPIVGSARDLVKWQLDKGASNDAPLGWVPVRSLADFRTARRTDKPTAKSDNGILRALSLEGLDLALSLLAPEKLEVGGGLIMFGGDGQPGMVDLKVTGGINDRGPGTLKGAIGSLDTTIKDLRLGPVSLNADRLHFDSLDQLVVTFDGFRPVKVDVLIRRVTATNLALQIGRRVEVGPR